MPEHLGGEHRRALRQRVDERVEVGEAGQAGDGGPDRRVQPETQGGDDRQPAFGAGQEAGRVHPGDGPVGTFERGDDGAVGEDRLDPRHLVRHAPEPAGVEAAGVGGERPAHRRRIPGCHVEPELVAALPGVPGDLGDGGAGCRHHGTVVVGDPPERLQVEDHGPRRSLGGAHEPGVASLGHQPESRFGGEPHQRHHLLHRRRADDAGGPTPEPARPVDGVAGDDVGIVHHPPTQSTAQVGQPGR